MNIARLAVLSVVCTWPAVAASDGGCPPGGAARPAQVVFGGPRPMTLSVPANYDAHCAAPLLLVLHGYGSSGKQHEAYFGLTGLVEGHGVLLAAPDGTKDKDGHRFWDTGTDACCNFSGTEVDDVKYLRDLLAEIRAVYNVDARRIFVVGHSNGAFMAHRLGCELSGDVAAVVSLAGTTSSRRGERCRPKAPLSVLQIHADRDESVRYAGGAGILGRDGGVYPGALATTAQWALDDGCTRSRVRGAALDLDSVLPGAETTVSTYMGCPRGTNVTLWTIHDGGHAPAVADRFPGLVWPWLQAHARRR